MRKSYVMNVVRHAELIVEVISLDNQEHEESHFLNTSMQCFTCHGLCQAYKQTLCAPDEPTMDKMLLKRCLCSSIVQRKYLKRKLCARIPSDTRTPHHLIRCNFCCVNNICQHFPFLQKGCLGQLQLGCAAIKY